MSSEHREEVDTLKEAMHQEKVFHHFTEWITEAMCAVKVDDDTEEERTEALTAIAEDILDPLTGTNLMRSYDVEVTPIDYYSYDVTFKFWFDRDDMCWMSENEIIFDNEVDFEF